MSSAYQELASNYNGKVQFGNPVPSGKRPAQLGLVEITKEIDVITAKMTDTNPGESYIASTAKMRSQALRRWLDAGKTVYIKTATGMGHARFWSTL